MKTIIEKLRNKIAKRTAKLGIIPIFDDRGHHYKFPGGEEYNSITQKLKVVKDPSIDIWAKNRALGYLRSKWMDIYPNGTEQLEKVFNEASEAPVLEYKNAGTIGVMVHLWRQNWFNQWIENGAALAPPLPEDPATKASCEAIRRAVLHLKAQPLACELALADKKTKTGGTADDIWRVGDENWFIDLKTSNIGNKNSYMLQVAAYVHMFVKLYRIKIDRVFILHTSKAVFGEYELIPVKHSQRYWEMAKVAFKLSDMLQELEEIKKPQGVKI